MLKHTVPFLTLAWLLAFSATTLAQPTSAPSADICAYQPTGSGVVVTVDLAKVQAILEGIEIPAQYLEMMPTFGPPTGVPMSPISVLQSFGIDTTRSAVLAFYGDDVFDHATRYGEVMALLLGDQTLDEAVPGYRAYGVVAPEDRLRFEPSAAALVLPL